jgi:uncharacterized membrane protein YkvA (DUF1232 family)
MPIKVTFEISDADLKYFRSVMRDARKKAKVQDEGTILAAARRLARQTSDLELPKFVTDRLESLDTLTRMLEDREWNMQGDHRARVLQALAYFAEPLDLIPDQIPGLGFLDDAIMVELVVQELRPELEAYDAFCGYRKEQRARKNMEPEAARKQLEAQRRQMYARIERRREQRVRRGGSFSIFR